MDVSIDTRRWTVDGVGEVLLPPDEYELIPVRKRRRRGAPRKSAEQRADVRIAQAVRQAEDHLRAAYRISSARKKAGGYQSSEELIEEDLRRRGYDRHQVQAVIGARTLRGAANQYVALKERRSVASVKSMACRGRKPPRAKDATVRKLTINLARFL